MGWLKGESAAKAVVLESGRVAAGKLDALGLKPAARVVNESRKAAGRQRRSRDN